MRSHHGADRIARRGGSGASTDQLAPFVDVVLPAHLCYVDRAREEADEGKVPEHSGDGKPKTDLPHIYR